MLERVKTLIASKINKVLSSFEDPREQLDYAYEKMIQQLHNVDMSLTTAIAARKKLEFRRERIKEKIRKNEENAEEAMKLGRKDLARMAIERKVLLEEQLRKLNEEIESMKKDEEKLKTLRETLRTKVDSFAAKKEMLKAQYETAEAQKEIKETLTGLSNDAANAGAIVRRAEEKINDLKAKSAAIDELIATGGAINYMDEEERDILEKELEKERIKSRVDEEIKKLEAET